MQFMKKVSAIVSTSAIVAVGLSSLPAHSQQARPPAGWFKVCSKQDDNDICNTQIQNVASTGQVITAISLIQIKGKVNRSMFQITVPSGRFIPAGLKLSIDGKQNTQMNYVYCFPQSCMAEVGLDDKLVSILKAGGNMSVTSVNFQNKENPVNVTLEGFTAAFDGPPLKRDELASRQEQLQNSLQKKAEAARKKLQEAQNAAKAQ
ncbi:MAG: invasion associated locus B family protein [Nitratireductor sp.]